MTQKRRIRIATLRKRIRDDDPGTRRTAIRKVQRLGNVEALKVLIVAVADPDDGIRGEAASALGNLRVPSAVTPLLQALERSGPYARGAAFTALAQIGSPVPPGMLLPFILDRDIGLRVNMCLDVLCPGWDRTAVATDMVAVAIDALGNSPQRNLCGAIAFLGRMRARQAVPILRSCLHRHSDYVHKLATEALALIADPALLPQAYERYLNQHEIDTWWGKVEESGWLAEVPSSEGERIRTGLAAYIGYPENAFVVLSPATIQTETIYKSGDYQRWVLSNYRAASFGSFVPQHINDRVDVKTGVAEVSFRVGNAVFSRRFRQEGEKVAAAFTSS